MIRRKSRKLVRLLVYGILLVVIGVGLSFLRSHILSVQTNQSSLWQFQSIDTMKYSRDPSRDPNIYKLIPGMVKKVADLHPTYIAIATPYDEEFYPVLKTWVDEARKYHLHIWFRGNFSGWEGWFDYPTFTEITTHHVLTKKFITSHPELFAAGDIFTPVPEPENGGMGDPRGSEEKAQQFNQFLVDSYNNCVQSFQQIHITVKCGYFSMNGDVAKDILTKDTVKKTGNVVVIDHYVATPEDMEDEILTLYKKFDAPIVLGEFGAPIPDINGDMTEDQQASFIKSLLQVFYNHQAIVSGINYWVIAGGSTALTNDDGSYRKVASVIKQFYAPNTVSLQVKDTAGDQLHGASITTQNGEKVTTDAHGNALFLSPFDNFSLTTNLNGYKAVTTHVLTSGSSNDMQLTITLTPEKSNFFYMLRSKINSMLHK